MRVREGEYGTVCECMVKYCVCVNESVSVNESVCMVCLPERGGG